MNGRADGVRIGIDVGGTFTDFVLYDPQGGGVGTLKVLTTADNPAEGVMHGLSLLGVDLGRVSGVTHGTTTATNALIERRGAHTAFLTTEGFRDTLQIRRANRQELYSAQWTQPPALVPRRHRIEIRERLYWDGEVAVPLDEEQVRDVIETLAVRGIESVAVCFLHAYQHPVHEQRVKELITTALPDVFVTVSSECSQEFREFERGSTVAANAFIGPRVHSYMTGLRSRLHEAGLAADVAIMQSNGGTCTIEEAAARPVKLARSGPAGGAMALKALAELTGLSHIVGIDIGGTSADVSVVVDGRPRWTSPLEVEWGLPLLLASVDVVSIGAGGGSLGWLDDGGALHMGPQSAGASPGPACYGRGGTKPTATDAHLVLGNLSTEALGEGDLRLDATLAVDAIKRWVADPLQMNVEEAAEGMIRILDHAMLQAIRFVTLEKGYDPRDFALVGFGGGGPLHVVSLARELGIATAVVPVMPGVFSAWGMLTVDMVQDQSRTILRRRKALDNAELSAVLTDLRASIEAGFLRQGVDPSDVTYEYFLDMQYYGQTYSLPIGLGELDRSPSPSRDHDISAREEGVIMVPLDADSAERVVVTDAIMERAVERFHREHEREYGHADLDQELQIVHARVFGTAGVERPSSLKPKELAGRGVNTQPLGERPVYFSTGLANAMLWERDDLAPGTKLEGPAVIREASSTTVLPPGASADVDPLGNLIISTGI